MPSRLGARSSLVSLLPCALMTLAAYAPYAANALQISSGTSSQCINVPWHGSPVEGTPVRLRACDPWQNQQWVVSGGHITGVGGLCLGVQGGQPHDGAAVIYVSCGRTPSQNWRLVEGQIIGIGDKCLAPRGGNLADGTPLIITTCNNALTQTWAAH